MFQLPTNQTELRIFLGKAGYYRRFVHSFTKLLVLLHAAVSSRTKVSWTGEKGGAYWTIKEAISSSFGVGLFPHLQAPRSLDGCVSTSSGFVALGKGRWTRKLTHVKMSLEH